MIVRGIQVSGRVGATISSAIGYGCLLRRICNITLTSMGTLCITASFFLVIDSVPVLLSTLRLASFVFVYFSFDDFAGFSNLVSNALFFLRGGLPGLVVLYDTLAETID